MLLAELKLKFETLAGLYDYLLSLEAVTLKFLESGTIRLSLSYRKRASLLFCLKAAWPYVHINLVYRKNQKLWETV